MKSLLDSGKRLKSVHVFGWNIQNTLILLLVRPHARYSTLHRDRYHNCRAELVSSYVPESDTKAAAIVWRFR